MAVVTRDAEATRARILDAGLAEFATHGLAGARVDRIAHAAAANKNSIYRYFESKNQLFAAVLQRHMESVYTEVPFTPEDLPGFTVRLFDYAMAHPEMIRLMTWYGLERGADLPAATSATTSEKLAALALVDQHHATGDGFSPGFLFTVITAIGTAWTAVNPFWTTIDPEALNDVSALRSSIFQLVERLNAEDPADEATTLRSFDTVASPSRDIR